MTEEQKSAIIRCRNSGIGYATMAKDIGLAKDAVVAFCRRNGLIGNMAGKAQDTAGRCRECGAALKQTKGMKTRLFCSVECRKNGGRNTRKC